MSVAAWRLAMLLSLLGGCSFDSSGYSLGRDALLDRSPARDRATERLDGPAPRDHGSRELLVDLAPGKELCKISCGGKLCGAGDGCGGICGAGSGCCAPVCTAKPCGSGNGCGGTCGAGSGCCNAGCNGPICGAKDGCGATCYGENDDSCAGVALQSWRCVQSKAWSALVSQVCTPAGWQIFNLNPSNCAACCGPLTPQVSLACKQ